jgi:hypothetical protein
MAITFTSNTSGSQQRVHDQKRHSTVLIRVTTNTSAAFTARIPWSLKPQQQKQQPKLLAYNHARSSHGLHASFPLRDQQPPRPTGSIPAHPCTRPARDLHADNLTTHNMQANILRTRIRALLFEHCGSMWYDVDAAKKYVVLGTAPFVMTSFFRCVRYTAHDAIAQWFTG